MLSGTADFEERLSWVYGAALRAAADGESAEQATRAAYACSPEGEPLALLMTRAVRFALARSPGHGFEGLPLLEREAIGLARILDLTVPEIAQLVGCDAAEVKVRMRRGLQRLADLVPMRAAG